MRPRPIPRPPDLATLEDVESKSPLGLQMGEIVQVRTEAEILDTLDEGSSLEALPFMPEMRKYCGRSFIVLKRIDKIVVERHKALRSMPNVVALDGVTCDGTAHGGCQNTCLILWKEQWLQRDRVAQPSGHPKNGQLLRGEPSHRTEAPFICQATSLPRASSQLGTWPLLQQCALEARAGELPLNAFARTLLAALYNRARLHLGLGAYYPIRGSCSTTPTIHLGLQPGEAVRVRSREEVAATLDGEGRNRGLQFFPDMLPCCGKTYRVLKRVDRLIEPTTGKMREMADTVILEEGICEGEATLGCRRGCYFLWREVWLERL